MARSGLAWSGMRKIFALALLIGMLVSTQPVLAAPFDFTIPGIDALADVVGNPQAPDLVIFAAGNQYMAMPDLVAAFQRAHPEVRSVFYETLPPGILARQITDGGITFGGLVLTNAPDIYLAGKKRMTQEVQAGIVSAPISYATNVLAIMVRKGNPKHITGLVDLGRSDVRVAMPNPAWEGIARQIEASYVKAGGTQLQTTIMKTKVAAGTTELTRIHHRQTPAWILSGKADAGPVWISEALYQSKATGKIATVRIPAKENAMAIYQAAMVKTAPHAKAGKAFLAFLQSSQARAIYAKYGFGKP